MSREGFFPEEEFKAPAAEESWPPDATDRFLELYLPGGYSILQIAQKLGRSPKSIRRRIDNFSYNERGTVEKYEPVRRTSRRGMKKTRNEREMLRAHKERGVSLRLTAKVLCRDLSEFGITGEQSLVLQDMKRLGTGVDLVLAYRYLYYVRGISILPDEAYDELEREEMEFGAGGDVLKKLVGSDVAEDYPDHVRSLALYLVFKYSEKEKK